MDESSLRRLLPRSDLNGVYALPARHLAQLRPVADALGFSFAAVDLHAVRQRRTALQRIASSLQFPEGFGGNLDALFDSLTDLSWRQAAGHVVVLSEAAALAKHDGDLARLLAVFADASEDWRRQAIPFWVLVDAPDMALPPLPSPATEPKTP